MSGHRPAGPVPAIDHDQLFKDLLTTFFVEFLLLFFPRVAASIDLDSIEVLPQEVYSGLVEGDKYLVDILAKARLKVAPDRTAFVLVHVEHQSTAPPDFLSRLFRYHLALLNHYGLPVFPIVVYSHDSPRKRQPRVQTISFADGEVLRFTPRVVQLNRLPWRRFLRSDNPVATALMAKMRVASRDRARLKLECLRLMVTANLDPRRMRLIGVFVDSYLKLNAAETARFERSLERTNLQPKQKEKIVEYTTSWKEEGIALGLEQGLQKGRQDGVDALRTVLVDILDTRFGKTPASVVKRLRRINSLDELRALTHRALIAPSLADLRLSIFSLNDEPE